MTIDEKIQYDINRETAEISPSLSVKLDKYEYVTGEEKLLFDQSRIIEQLKLTYSPLGKASEKLTKKIGDQGKKQKKNINTKKKYGDGFKILTPQQKLQRLPIALAQVKAGNTSENLLNEITQIINSLYPAKEITKKVYNNIMISIKVYYKMNNIFMNSKIVKHLILTGYYSTLQIK